MSEAQCLSAFDAMRTSIRDVAHKVYSRSRNNSTIAGGLWPQRAIP
jgi:hypothetical protein